MAGTSIQIDKAMHRRLKIIAAHTDMKLYELIREATVMLEEKYNLTSPIYSEERPHILEIEQ